MGQMDELSPVKQGSGYPTAVSDDNITGPYLRDRQGHRLPPASKERPPYWYEVLVFVLVRYAWLWIPLGLAAWWWRQQGVA